MRRRGAVVLLVAGVLVSACDDAAEEREPGSAASADEQASTRPRTSTTMLHAVHGALRDGDSKAWNELSWASAEDWDRLCPDRDRPSADASAFEDCRAVGPWERTKAGLRGLDHDGVNDDDRVCREVDGCPGLERLCKSELFVFEPSGSAELKISLSGIVRRKRDGALFLARPPRCVRKDARE